MNKKNKELENKVTDLERENKKEALRTKHYKRTIISLNSIAKVIDPNIIAGRKEEERTVIQVNAL